MYARYIHAIVLVDLARLVFEALAQNCQQVSLVITMFNFCCQPKTCIQAHVQCKLEFRR